jgi:Family of unknown function (DUF6949)
MREALIMAYATAVGFAASGMFSTLFQLIMGRPLAFAVPQGGAPSYFLAAIGFAVTGPYIISRAAFRARFVEKKSLGVLGGGLFIATLWSTCSGIAVLGLVLSLPGVG